MISGIALPKVPVSSDYLSLLRYLSFWQKCLDNTQIIWVILAGTSWANSDKDIPNWKYFHRSIKKFFALEYLYYMRYLTWFDVYLDTPCNIHIFVVKLRYLRARGCHWHPWALRLVRCVVWCVRSVWWCNHCWWQSFWRHDPKERQN